MTDEELVELNNIALEAQKASPEDWWVVPATGESDVHGIDDGNPPSGSDSFDLLENPPLELHKRFARSKNFLSGAMKSGIARGGTSTRSTARMPRLAPVSPRKTVSPAHLVPVAGYVQGMTGSGSASRA